MFSSAQARKAVREFHQHAPKDPKIAAPHKLNRNQSATGTGSVAFGSGVNITSRATTKTRILQMRAIQRRFFTDRGRACAVLMDYILLAKIEWIYRTGLFRDPRLPLQPEPQNEPFS